MLCRERNIEYIKELAYVISEMNLKFIPDIFNHCLVSALNDLCLIDI